jgi:uncharacterized protein YdiU (UPF0061 family)
MLLCRDAKTFCVPVFSIKVAEEQFASDEIIEFNPNKVSLVCEKKWFCENCVEKNKIYKNTDIISHRAQRIKMQKKRLTKMTAEKLMKDCYENYYKDYVAEWRRKHQERVGIHESRIRGHNEIIVEEQIAKENKQQFIKDLAQMLCEGTIEYKDYLLIMSGVVNNCSTSPFTKPNWREKLLGLPEQDARLNQGRRRSAFERW